MTQSGVAPIADIVVGEPIAVNLAGRANALYNVDGTVYATDATCTHPAGDLAEGHQDGDIIECLLHQGRFHIPTCKPVKEALRTYAVEGEGEDVFVQVPL